MKKKIYKMKKRPQDMKKKFNKNMENLRKTESNRNPRNIKFLKSNKNTVKCLKSNKKYR
jgi:hypothetical protein